MSVPKSVVKINKNGVQYISEVDKCQYFIFELCRAALRDVGKLVKKRFRESFYSRFKRHTGQAGKATSYKVYSNQNTQAPRIEIGLSSKAKGFYGYFQEVGSSKQPKLALLSNAVQDSLPDIIRIESQYLSAMEDEARALSLIDEKEYEDEDDE